MTGQLRAFRAVFGALLGIRRNADAQQDFGNIMVWQFIVAGVIVVAVFVCTLVVIVNLITA